MDCSCNDRVPRHLALTAKNAAVCDLQVNRMFYSFPIHMPGQILQMECSKPIFQVTLRGGADEHEIYENNQKPHVWKSQPVHYIMGRVVYDIIFPESIHNEEKEIKMSIRYSALTWEEKTENLKLGIRQWDFQFVPNRWMRLPEADKVVKIIHVKGWKYYLAVAGVPIRMFSTCSSSDGNLTLSQIPEQETSMIFNNGGLDFSKVFGAWLIFEDDLSSVYPEPQVSYTYV